jgi:phosphate transport system permease protein
MGYATGLHYNALFGTGIVLILVIILLLLVVNYFNYKNKVTIGGGYL